MIKLTEFHRMLIVASLAAALAVVAIPSAGYAQGPGAVTCSPGTATFVRQVGSPTAPMLVPAQLPVLTCTNAKGTTVAVLPAFQVAGFSTSPFTVSNFTVSPMVVPTGTFPTTVCAGTPVFSTVGGVTQVGGVQVNGVQIPGTTQVGGLGGVGGFVPPVQFQNLGGVQIITPTGTGVPLTAPVISCF